MNSSITTRLYQSAKGQFGKVKLSLEKKGVTVFRSEIPEEVVLEMQNDASRLMSLPFEVQFDSCNPYEFIEYFIIPHVKVISTNKLEFTDMPIGLLGDISITFLGEPSKIIVTHIKGCLYRICLHAEMSGFMMIVLQIGNFKSTEEVVVDIIPDGEPAQTLPTRP